MRKLLYGFLIAVATIVPQIGDARAKGVGLDHDTSDPLYMQAIGEVLSETTLTYWDNVLRLGERLSYGINNRLVVGLNVHFQQDFEFLQRSMLFSSFHIDTSHYS